MKMNQNTINRFSSFHSSSSSSTFTLFIEDRPFRISNPCTTYFDSEWIRPSYFTDFVYLMPEHDQFHSLYGSKAPPYCLTRCTPEYMSLDQFREQTDCCVIVKIFDCTRDNLSDLDEHLTHQNASRKYGQFEYLFNRYRESPVNTFDHDLLYFNRKNDGEIVENDPFACVCATSLIKGFGGSLYSAYHFWNVAVTEEDIAKTLTHFGLELLQLGLNFTPLNLIIVFLKLVNAWFKGPVLLEFAVKLFDKTHAWISRKTSTQPSSGQSVVATMLNIDLTNFASVKDSTPALASALASVCVLFGVLIVGKDVSSSDRYDTLSQKLAETMSCMSKFRSGIAAVKDMLVNFSQFMYETIFDLLGLESDSELLKLVRSSNVAEFDNCKKEFVFEYCKFLTNPSNLVLIQSNHGYRQQLEFSHAVLEDIRYKLAMNAIPMPMVMINYISSTLVELQKVRKAVSKTSAGSSSRFCPFWINFVGESHTGKSTFTSIFTKYLLDLLNKLGEKNGVNYEIPAESNRYYSVNFCDKFETNYTGQYVTLIDDFAQDGPGASENSSALKMVNWISSIPYFTNQAQLDNKGIPFTSKIIISTSNDLSLQNRKEIISPEALINRMSLCFKFSKDKTSKITNEWFPCPVKIEQYDFKTNKVIKVVTVEELIKICAEQYMLWFEKEKRLESYRQVDDSLINSIIESMHPSSTEAVNLLEVGKTSATEITVDKLCVSLPSESKNKANLSEVGKTSATGITVEKLCVSLPQERKDEEVTVVETSRWRCYLNLHPGYKQSCDVQVIDCDCEFHTLWNANYLGYISITDENPWTIDQFIDLSINDSVSIRTLQQDFGKSWSAIARKVTEYYHHPYFKLFAGAVTAFLAGTYAYKMFAPKETSEDEDEEIPSFSASAKYTTNVRRLRTKKTVIATDNTKVVYASSFEHLTDMFNDQFCTNAIEIARDTVVGRGLVCNLESDRKINTGLRIHGSAILTNHHFMNGLEEGSKLKISYSDHLSKCHVVEQIFNRERMYRIGTTDLVVYNCDSSLAASRSIIKHFPTSLSVAKHVQALVITADPIPTVYANIRAKPCTFRAEYKVGNEVYDTLDSWETNCPVRFGMSGSVLFSLSNTDKHKIIGIQTCKNNNSTNSYGYFKPVSQEQLREALKALNVFHVEVNTDAVVKETCLVKDNLCPANLQNNSLTYLGTVPKAKCIRAQTESKIIPSLIHKADEVTQLPSVLSDYDLRMDESIRKKPIIFRAIEGFDHKIGSIDNTILNKAVDQLKIEYDVELDVEGISRRVLNHFEMINGVPGVMLPVDMKTSPGYPYVLERKNTTKGGKFEWFEELEDFPSGYGKAYSMKSSLLSGVEQAEQQLKDGVMPPFVAYCCLKDETRPVKKIVEGKTRAFICLPLHYNLLVRKYFGAFTSAQKKRAGIISSCVGVDPANDWVRLFNKLNNKNTLWEDFDYANWDQYLHPELVMRVADVVNYWYRDGEENAKVRKLLLYNLIHTVLIVKDRLFLKSQGQCSGCAITAELNCLVHDILMAYVWIKLHQDQGLFTSISEMRDQVALCVYGDDIIMSVDPLCDIKFNGTEIAPIMSDLGMNITPGDKVSTTFELKPPEEIYFLKRNFVLHGEKVFAPLRSDIVENIIQWIHKSDDSLEATRLNCVTALQESYMHRRAYFNKLSNEIHERIKVLNKSNPGLDFPAIIVDYEELERKHYLGRYICAGFNEPEYMSYTE